MYEKSQKSQHLALFDFDGTLCKIDSFTGFIFFALPKWQIFIRGFFILPWIIAYYLKLYPAHQMRPKLFKQMFKGQNLASIDLAASAYAQQLIQKHLNPQLFQQLCQHKKLDHHVILVSASIDLYLEYICKILNIDLICSQVEYTEHYLTGCYLTPDCSNEQKCLRILYKFNPLKNRTIYAYGNSQEDNAMLSLTKYSYMVGKDEKMPSLNEKHADYPNTKL